MKLGVVYSDVVGPISVTSLGGASYWVTFIDDFSRKTWLFPISSKDKVFKKFKHFKARVENESGCSIKTFGD